ncbi:MAG: hypothetical protein LKI76_07840 [Megasphaera sp.]|jgi:hypothetical protein|uniref:hypothetical protein n=1 Tax=Megasphaera sueciensis TaxID=349094 RepID=UPI003D073543|nr:hypothetical protein [Megasphaera sp.]
MKKLLLASHSLLFLFFFMSLANIQYNQDICIFLIAVVVSAYIVTTPPNIFKTWFYYTLNSSLFLLFYTYRKYDHHFISILLGMNIVLRLIDTFQNWIRFRKQEIKELGL